MSDQQIQHRTSPYQSVPPWRRRYSNCQSKDGTVHQTPNLAVQHDIDALMKSHDLQYSVSSERFAHALATNAKFRSDLKILMSKLT